MDRFDTYYKQVVTQAELDAMLDAAEDADHSLAIDHGLFGVANGMGVGQHGVGDLTVDVAGGAAYDQAGQRIYFPSTQNLDVSLDSLGASTAVGVLGNEKWVSVFVKFKRVESDPRVDGYGTPLSYSLAEGYEFHVVQSAEAVIPTAVRPATISDGVLLADIHRIKAQTQVLTADIDMQTYPTGRRQDVCTIQLVGRYTQQDGYGRWDDAAEALANILDTHTSGTDYVHPSTDITSAALTGNPVSWPSNSTARVHMQQTLDGFNLRCAIAAGLITSTGVITYGVNVASVGNPAVGEFLVTLTTGALTGFFGVGSVSVNPPSPGGAFVHVVPISQTQAAIYIRSYLGVPQDVAFSFICIGY